MNRVETEVKSQFSSSNILKLVCPATSNSESSAFLQHLSCAFTCFSHHMLTFRSFQSEGKQQHSLSWFFPYLYFSFLPLPWLAKSKCLGRCSVNWIKAGLKLAGKILIFSSQISRFSKDQVSSKATLKE